MKHDIQTRDDLFLLVKTFYEKLFADELLQTIFIDVAKIKLEEHLPILVDFWDSILLDGDTYRRNQMEKHTELNKKFRLEKQHFDQWIFLWNQTIDELFIGEKAEHAKFRAKSIADIMSYKMDYLNKEL
ncbi:MAG: group III truncated hemoglobin [Chitinophagales bacterium]|nr:group III truncated hemoglobin [Saprospirales bacterium]MBP6660387.1 group III truncated hemoglobin [Chitinophagales bacterium]